MWYIIVIVAAFVMWFAVLMFFTFRTKKAKKENDKEYEAIKQILNNKKDKEDNDDE